MISVHDQTRNNHHEQHRQLRAEQCRQRAEHPEEDGQQRRELTKKARVPRPPDGGRTLADASVNR